MNFLSAGLLYCTYKISLLSHFNKNKLRIFHMDLRRSKRNIHNSSIFEPVDRISGLPDSVLSVILSLLPTKNAIATCTLSKRWEFMWRTVQNLDFCLDVRRYSDDEQLVKNQNEKFVAFVNHVLLHHDPGILNEFRLVWTCYCSDSHVAPWIKIATARNAQWISVTLEIIPFVMMPISAFRSDSLRSLKLGGFLCITATRATVFCFPRLESLDLFGVIGSQRVIEKIVKGCPVLNDLKIDIDENDEDDKSTFVISSTSLKRLELKLGYVSRYLKVEASSLEHLTIHNNGFVYMNFVPNNLTSLVEADLSFNMDCKGEYYPEDDICNSIGDAVSALDCVQILTLSEDVMWVLSFTSISSSTRFKRLVKLKVSIYVHWSSLQELIQQSDNLEELTIQQYLICLEDESGNSNWTATPVEVPRCLSTSLMDVCYIGYIGLEDEREMIRYMLEHGSVLEDMDIQISSDVESDGEKLTLVQEICEIPRKSPVCKVRFPVEP